VSKALVAVVASVAGTVAVAVGLGCGDMSPVIGTAAPATGDAAGDTAGDAAADVGCPLTVDDAGVTHGCGRGGQGPGDHDDGGGMAPPPPDAAPDAANLPFGASCLDNAQCDSGMCFDFTVRGTFCTKPCGSNADCPMQSLGCNGMGVCRVGN
jgi:hypothetical protein